MNPARHRTSTTRFVFIFICCLSVACFFASCQPQQAEQGQRFELRGKVVAVDKTQHQVTVSHDEIKNYMPAMTMPFVLKDTTLFDDIAAGDEINATLVVGKSASWLEDVIVTREAVDQSNQMPPPTVEPSVGAEVPDFTLVNQDGKRIRLKQYRGRALLLTFIYTRCPLPDYCTLMSNNFAEINKELQKTDALYQKTHLLSISFDTGYDTPKVLRSYGASHTGNYSSETFEHWEFATGSQQEIKQVAEFFGLTYVPASGQFTHSLRTAIIAPDGKLFKIYRGNEWKPEEALRDLQSVFDQK